jgi:hypothetical protein
MSHRIDALESRVTDWELMLNRSHNAIQGEMIQVVSALTRLSEEFAALRLELVHAKAALLGRK